MPEENQPLDYSIVICTYNPDERLLRRCLKAVHNLDVNDITMEVILVDNNSQVPVETLYYVREYLAKIRSMKASLDLLFLNVRHSASFECAITMPVKGIAPMFSDPT